MLYGNLNQRLLRGDESMSTDIAIAIGMLICLGMVIVIPIVLCVIVRILDIWIG